MGGVGAWCRAAAGSDPRARLWTYVDSPRALRAAVKKHRPRWVFLLHWRWRVPADVLRATEVVGFHMTKLPWGRGGSPLQHLILLGKRRTTLTAFRVTDELDAGPIYATARLDLRGSAAEVYERAAYLSLWMASWVVNGVTGQPKPQRALRATDRRFVRRTANALPVLGLTARGVYDYVRMLDAPGYEHAYLEVGDWRFSFTDAGHERGSKGVTASVRITRRKA